MYAFSGLNYTHILAHKNCMPLNLIQSVHLQWIEHHSYLGPLKRHASKYYWKCKPSMDWITLIFHLLFYNYIVLLFHSLGFCVILMRFLTKKLSINFENLEYSNLFTSPCWIFRIHSIHYYAPFNEENPSGIGFSVQSFPLSLLSRCMKRDSVCKYNSSIIFEIFWYVFTFSVIRNCRRRTSMNRIEKLADE